MKHLFLLLIIALPNLLSAEIATYATFQHDDRIREHYLFVPEDANVDTPLIVALHGMGGNAANLRFGIGLTEAAAAAGFAVVYPQGIRLPQGSRHWNAGMDMIAVDDLGYLTALVQSVTQQHQLDPNNTVFFGISMGGYMAYHMACHSGLNITAIVSVSGTISGNDWGHCRPSDWPSLLHIHGQKDPMIRFGGSMHWSGAWGKSPAVPELVAFWAQQIGGEPDYPLLNHPKVSETRFTGVETGREVQLLVLPQMGHDWPTENTAGFRALEPILAFLLRQRNSS